MSLPDEKKPREWKLVRHKYTEGFQVYNDLMKIVDESPNAFEQVHVIEYSALDHMAIQYAELQDETLAAKKERDELQARVRELEDALKAIVKKAPEKVSIAEAADMAIEFKITAEAALKGSADVE